MDVHMSMEQNDAKSAPTHVHRHTRKARSAPHHQQQDQYLFSHGLRRQSSESRLIIPTGFHRVGRHPSPSPPRRDQQTPSRAQQNPRIFPRMPRLNGRSKSLVPWRSELDGRGGNWRGGTVYVQYLLSQSHNKFQVGGEGLHVPEV